jgi:hypothetical protein
MTLCAVGVSESGLHLPHAFEHHNVAFFTLFAFALLKVRCSLCVRYDMENVGGRFVFLQF